MRQAEDVGGQELSYAEVKAIASGNPAVLVLAEADAELQRLEVACSTATPTNNTSRGRTCRNCHRLLSRLSANASRAEADAKTIDGGDGGVLIVGGRSVAPQDAALCQCLNRIPEQVDYRRRFPVGKYRGLTFGIEKYPGGAADVYLEGQSSPN